MQRLSFALLFALCVAVVLGQDKVSKAGFYSYTPPKGFEAVEPRGTDYAFAKGQNGTMSMVILWTRNTKVKTTAELRESFLSDLADQEAGKPHITVHSAEITSVDGKQVVSALASSMKNGQRLYQRQIMALHKGKCVVIMGTYAGDHKKMDKEFLASLSKFKWQ